MAGFARTGLLVVFIGLIAQAVPAGQAHEAPDLWNPEMVPWIASAEHRFVAPDGKPDNRGTMDSPWDLRSALEGRRAVAPGAVLWLRAGTYGAGGTSAFTCRLRGTQQRPIIVRGYPGERATVDGGIFVPQGPESWAWFWGLEVSNSSPDRTQRSPGLNLDARGCRAINLIIHDVGHSPVSFWERVGDGGEIHGCVVWAAGFYDMSPYWKGSPRGSAFYMQNKDGTRYVTDNICFRNFTTGMKAYTEKGYADGFDFEGNVVFDNGSWNLWGSGGTNPMKRLKVIGNYSYRKPNDDTSSVQFGAGRHHEDAEIRDNCFAAGRPGAYALKVANWDSLSISGNTFYGTLEGVAEADFPDNTYLKSRPAGAQVFVRPNKYEPGRGHVIAYNWDRKPAVEADLSSILSPGAEFEVRDAQNYYGGPVVKGVYDGKPVSLPMNLTEVAAPIGKVPHIAARFTHTAPEFAAFVVLGRGGAQPGAGAAAEEAPTPVITPRGGVFLKPVEVQLSLQPAAADAAIRYTTDGAEPAETSPLYTAPFTVAGKAVVRARAFRKGADPGATVDAHFRVVPEKAPPVCSQGAPMGRLPGATTETTLRLETDEDAVCKFATEPGVAYVDMAQSFATTARRTHAHPVGGLRRGAVYRFYVKAQDALGNADLDDYVITFFVGDGVVPFRAEIEAESGRMTAPMAPAADGGASGGKYVACEAGVAGDGGAAWTFTVPATDDYVVWARNWSSDSGADSFYVSVDGGEDVFDMCEDAKHKEWRWTAINGRGGESAGKVMALNPRIFTLEKGEHTLLFRGREMNARLDRLIITNDRTLVPRD